MKQITQQTAIVTGAGQGIGFEICRQLASRGINVLLNDIDEQLATRAAEDINREFDKCYALTGDASDPLFIKEMVDVAVEKFGQLTMAVANAGITSFGEFLSYKQDDLYKVLHTNVGGTFLLAQAAIKQMKKQGRGGSVLFMSSVTGHQAHKNLAAYSMSKAAIEMLAKNLVIEISEFGINVNTIAPGATLTERTRHETDYEEIWSRITPMRRPATPGDVANTALFLLSEEARHITGQTIIVDGGWTCVSPSPYME